MDNRPIGIFDSGIGGLTIMSEIQDQLPGEDILYLGDTARVPYGSRSKETVTQYALESSRYLTKKGIKALIIACNTASALALDEVKAEISGIPVFGVIKPGARAAAKATKNKVVGVIGTEATVRSQAYQRQVRKHIRDAEIIGIGCPLFVPIIEEGWQNSSMATLTAQTYLSGFDQHEIDTLILGCTHYPALRATIQRVMGAKVRLVNPAYETAKEVKHVLTEKGMLSDRLEGGEVQFFVTDAPERFQRVGGFLLNDTIYHAEKVDLLAT